MHSPTFIRIFSILKFSISTNFELLKPTHGTARPTHQENPFTFSFYLRGATKSPPTEGKPRQVSLTVLPVRTVSSHR